MLDRSIFDPIEISARYGGDEDLAEVILKGHKQDPILGPLLKLDCTTCSVNQIHRACHACRAPLSYLCAHR